MLRLVSVDVGSISVSPACGLEISRVLWGTQQTAGTPRNACPGAAGAPEGKEGKEEDRETGRQGESEKGRE